MERSGAGHVGRVRVQPRPYDGRSFVGRAQLVRGRRGPVFVFRARQRRTRRVRPGRGSVRSRARGVGRLCGRLDVVREEILRARRRPVCRGNPRDDGRLGRVGPVRRMCQQTLSARRLSRTAYRRQPHGMQVTSVFSTSFP